MPCTAETLQREEEASRRLWRQLTYATPLSRYVPTGGYHGTVFTLWLLQSFLRQAVAPGSGSKGGKRGKEGRPLYKRGGINIWPRTQARSFRTVRAPGSEPAALGRRVGERLR